MQKGEPVTASIEFKGSDRQIVQKILQWALSQTDCSTPEGNLARLSLEIASAHVSKRYKKVRVYGLREKGTSEIRYIGQTTLRLSQRLASHRCVARTGRPTPRMVWISTLKSDGSDCEIVELEDRAVKDLSEKYHIARHRYYNADLLNRTVGGTGNHGMVHTEAARRRMTATRKGVPLSKAHRRSISLSQKGKTVSAITCANISKGLMGRKLTDAHKKTLSEVRRGRKQNLSIEERERRRQKMISLNKNHPQWLKRNPKTEPSSSP